MDKFIASAAEHSQTLIKQRDYLLRVYREGRLNYAKVSDHKLPIGSGEERKFNPPSCQFKNERKQEILVKGKCGNYVTSPLSMDSWMLA